MVVVQAEGVDQNVNRRTILAAQRRFKVAQAAALRHHFGVLLPLFGREIKLRGNIDLQQFLAAAVSQHPHHGVIDFDETAARRAEEQAFLNVVEQFAIATLGLAPVGNIFQHVDGLQAFVRSAMHARGRNQVGPIKHRMRELVGIVGHRAAERARVRRGFVGQGQQRAHIHADQFGGRNPDHRSQRPVHAQNLIRLVVHDDEVGDGIENLHPVTVRLLDTGEQSRVLQRHGGVPGHGLEEYPILRVQRRRPAGKA